MIIMKWEGRQKSENVDDRRGRSSAPRVGAGLGIGTLLIVLIGYLLGFDLSGLMTSSAQYDNSGYQQEQQQGSGIEGGVATADGGLGDFVKVVLKDTEDVWNKLFRERYGRDYPEPTMVLFTGRVQSACGFASSATGPFYCPADEQVYIDLQFYQELKTKFQVSGDFAMAYVIAHEVGHHIQKQLGYTEYVHKQKGRVPETEYNQLSVRLELMADYLAGVWAHHAHKMKNILEEGDLEEALDAAHAIGDDTIQKRSRGYVVPDSFTHGSSEQRIKWFREGLMSGGNLSQEYLDQFFTSRSI